MWTTSSFRAERAVIAPLAALLLAAACAGRAATSVADGTPAPDAPRAVVLDNTPVAPVQDTGRRLEPVELRSARVIRLASDTMLARLFRSPAQNATEPLVLEVLTARPLARLGPTSSPEIFLNDERPGDSYAVGPNRLVVLLTDRRRIRPTNTVTVAWLGNEPQTRSRQPLTIRADELPR